MTLCQAELIVSLGERRMIDPPTTIISWFRIGSNQVIWFKRLGFTGRASERHFPKKGASKGRR